MEFVKKKTKKIKQEKPQNKKTVINIIKIFSNHLCSNILGVYLKILLQLILIKQYLVF